MLPKHQEARRHTNQLHALADERPHPAVSILPCFSSCVISDEEYDISKSSALGVAVDCLLVQT